MSRNSQTDKEILARLEASLAEDVLTSAYSKEEVGEELREEGGDPESIGRRGTALAGELLEHRRLFWRRAAQRRNAEARNLLSAAPELTRLTRDELLGRLDAARRDPELGGVTAAYRNRKPEEASDEELRAILSEIEMLRQLAAFKRERGDESKNQ